VRKYQAPLFFLLLLLGWEIAGRMTRQLAFLLPPPTNIVQRLVETPALFLYHTSITLREMGIGLLLALLLALPIAWLMAHRHFPRAAFQPLFLLFQSLPAFTLAPLMVLWFDWSLLSIILPTTVMILFPLTLAVYQGLKSTPKEFIDFFWVNGATSWTLFWRLELPWAMPHLFAGLRISAAVAGIAAIGGEWAGGQAGLGTFMQESRRAIDIQALFGTLLCLAAATGLLYLLITSLEKALSRPRQRRARIWPICTALLLALLVLPGHPTSSKGDVRLLLDWLPNPNHIPLFAGLEEGLFADEGIDLRILKLLDPADAIPYLTSGQAEVAIYYSTVALRAVSSGAQLRVIGTLIDHPLEVCLYHKREGIERPEELSGRVVGHFADPVQLSHLKNLRANVKPVLVNFDIATAFASGALDATFGVFRNIEAAQMEALGIPTGYFPVEELGAPDYPELILISTGRWLANDPTFADRFRTALAKSIAFAQTHPEMAFRHYVKHNPEKSAATLVWERLAWERTLPLLAMDQEADFARWEKLARWLQNEGVVANNICLQEVLRCLPLSSSSPILADPATSLKSTPSSESF
jgi:NitT/TauT family transport system permease protein/NitT/TauT family transport system substrate-binding protein